MALYLTIVNQDISIMIFGKFHTLATGLEAIHLLPARSSENLKGATIAQDYETGTAKKRR